MRTSNPEKVSISLGTSLLTESYANMKPINIINIYDFEKGEILLSNIDNKKTYIVFYKKTCSGCHEVIKYLDDNKIKYDKYDLDTADGLAMAGMCEVLSLCMKMIPIIIENNEY